MTTTTSSLDWASILKGLAAVLGILGVSGVNGAFWSTDPHASAEEVDAAFNRIAAQDTTLDDLRARVHRLEDVHLAGP